MYAIRFLSRTHSEGQILGGEDTREMLVIVHNQDAVGSLGSTQLTGIGYADALRYGKSREWSQGRDGTSYGSGSETSGATTRPGTSSRGGRLASLAVQVRLDLFPDSLQMGKEREGPCCQPYPLQWLACTPHLTAHLIPLVLPLPSIGAIPSSRRIPEAGRSAE